MAVFFVSDPKLPVLPAMGLVEHVVSDTLHLSSSTTIVLLLFVLSTALVSAYTRSSKNTSYPPGPRGYPYIGSINIPFKKPWFTYIEWGNKYNSELIHYTRFGRHYLIINTLEAATDLLEKNSRFTSDRCLSSLDIISGWRKIVALLPYSEEWRLQRKVYHQNFRAEASVRFHPAEIHCVREFAKGLIKKSELTLMDQIATLSQKIMFKALYGLEISTNKDSIPESAREVIDAMEDFMMPGRDGLKSSPFHRLFPSLKKSVPVVQQQIDQTVEGPWDLMMDALKSDPSSNRDFESSLIPNLISKLDADADSNALNRIKLMGGTAIAAAADTTMSSISTFFLAMSFYPDVQAKAQKELDTVLGPGKLPTFEDRSSLPYIEAVYREVMRWHPAIPLGLPHGTSADIFYKGYYIPKGTIIFSNIWAMTHNPSTFTNPDAFIPERHIQKDGKFESINSIWAYGFGRRVCIGRHMANDTIWLAIATVLATTKITKLPNENVEDYFSDASFCTPKLPDYMTLPRFEDMSFST
ncbi:cytochrome p450 [Stygiomarasmius scandens]|uniref:Cytochrome p450 n=1 Tax=Marasmiellus scandens TaxID=2682957 RepID=A0ABR1J3B2_9AGAR